MSTGAQWRAEVKAEAARQAKGRRNQRGRRRDASRLEFKPGMGRLTMAHGDGDGDHPQPQDHR